MVDPWERDPGVGRRDGRPPSPPRRPGKRHRSHLARPRGSKRRRAGRERRARGGHVVHEQRSRRRARPAIHAPGAAATLGPAAADLGACRPGPPRQSATASAVRCASASASTRAWLKPRRRSRRGCSGTGTSAPGASSQPAGAPATICAAIASATRRRPPELQCAHQLARRPRVGHGAQAHTRTGAPAPARASAATAGTGGRAARAVAPVRRSPSTVEGQASAPA